jgi:CHAT domain-containing protein
MLLKSATHLSESELNNYVHTFSNNFDQILSFTQTEVDQAFRLVPLSYSNVLFNKGFLLNASCQVRRLALSDSTSSMKYYMLKGYNNSLAAEYSLPIAERDSAMLVDLEEKANSLEKDLVRTVAGLGDVLRQITWQEVRDILQPNEAAIEFVHYRYYNSKNQITDSTMYAALLLLHGDTIPHFIPLCEERQLEALLPVGSAMDDLSMTKLRAISIQQLYASSSMAGRPALYNLLWSAIDKTLVKFGIKTVYFAPSGVLHRLNLEALTWDKSGRTLADQYHLVQLGSTRELAFNAASKDNRPSSAVIYGGVQYAMDSTAIARAIKDLALVVQGNPGGFIRNSFQDNRQNNTRGGEAVYGYTWKYLKSTEEEAHFLYDLLDRQHVFASLHIGYSATEESVKRIGAKAPSPGLIHIGTHGFFFADPKDPVNKLTFGTVSNKSTFMISDHPLIRSGLLFAGAQYAWDHNNPISGMEDGILTALEVSQMNLSNTQLVVLSACETGLGDIKGNEGVYGLQRAFRIAGAKNVLMSLWQVSDDATQKLMTCFYNKWLVEKQPLRAAFEAAQQWLRGEEGYGNPYYWAGFVLVGEL